MARQDVYRKYDENGNVVDEVRLDEGTSEYEAAKKAREGGGGQVGNYYIKNGTGDITKKNNLADYASDLTELYAPVIKVNKAGDGLVISGSKTAINNDMAKQLQSYLDDTFKYADLKSESVAEALEALNKDLYSQVEERVVSGGIGMNYDDYKEYRNTLQQLQGTNPLKSTGVVPGYDRDGKKVYKTIADWISYYRSYYSTSERADLFRGALALMEGGNTDPALWTPYLAMSGGTGASPVYGFDAGERLSTGWESFMNEMAKLIQGGAQNAVRTAQYLQNIGGYNRRDKLNKVAHEIELGRKVNSSEVRWMSEDNFNKKLESIIGKRVGELNSSEKTFLATAVAGNMNSDQMKDVMAAISDNGVITDDIRNLATYKSYIDERDNLSTTEKYDVEMDKAVDAVNSGRDWLQRDVNLGSIYAPVETTIGAFAGTMLRMWAEAGLIKYATGGIFNPAGISDFLAGKLISGLEKIAPASGALRALQTPVGSFLLSVTAELPEDVVQTVIDDVMIGRGEDIPLLAPTGDINKDMEKLGESFAQNLAFRLAFTPLHVGAQKVKAWRAAKNAANAVDMDATVSDQLFVRNQQLKDAADKGNIVDLTENSATIRNQDGTETVLDNVAMLHFGTDPELQERYPAIAEMVRKKGLVNDIAESDIQQRIDGAKTAVENGEYADMSAGIVKNADGELVDLTGKPVSVEATSDDGIVVYRGQPKGEDGAFIPNDPTNKSEWGDVFFFIENPNYASSFGDDIVYFEFPKEKVVTLSEYADIKNMANDIVGDELEFNKYVAEHGEAAGALLEEISYDNARAVAEYTGKPIVETAWKGDASGSEYSYFPGVDSEFDESAVTHSLSSTSPLAPQASAANIEMSNQIQKALNTQPYGDSVAEIVADKYKQGAAEMSEAPSSGSYRWESPDVTKVYKTEEEVFADRPVGKNMTEVRQWQKNAEAFYMNKYREDVVPKFRESYPTVDEQQQFVRNMDFLFDQQRVGGEDLVVKSVEAQSEQPVVVKTDGGVVYTVSDEPGVETVTNQADAETLIKKLAGDNDSDMAKKIASGDKPDEIVSDKLRSGINSINKKFHAGEALTDGEAKNADFVDSLFVERTTEPKTLYRYQPRGTSGRLKQGKTITPNFWQFTSENIDRATTYKNISRGGVMYKYNIPENSPILDMTGFRQAADPDNYAHWNEILLPRNTEYRITKVTKPDVKGKIQGNYTEVELTPVTEAPRSAGASVGGEAADNVTPSARSAQRIKELDEEIASLNKDIERMKAEVKERQTPQYKKQTVQDFHKLDYETRKQMVKEFVRHNPEYVAVYRVQNTGVDDWYANGRGVHGDNKTFDSYGSDKGDLKDAVWLTTDEAWAEGDERASAGALNGTPDQTVVIPIKRSLIVDAGGEMPSYNPELGEADMSYYDSPYYSLRRFSELNNNKIVQTRATRLEDKWLAARDENGGVTNAMRNRLNPEYYDHTELVLFKDKLPKVKAESEQAVVDFANKEARDRAKVEVNSRVNQRAIRNLEDDINTTRGAINDLKKQKGGAERELASQLPEVDSADYRTGIVKSDTPFGEARNEGYYKFNDINIEPTSRDIGSLAIEQTLVTPGGPIDTLNAAIRSGEVEVKNGKVDENALRQAIEEGYDEEVFAYNFYNDPTGGTYFITEIADELGVKHTDEKSASKAVKEFVVNEAMKKFYEGNTTAKNNIILYRVISSDGNEVATSIIGGEKPKQGNIDWLKKESGDYVDNGVGFVTMDPEVVLGNEKLAGSGDRYILRMHIAKGTPMYSFENRVLTGGPDILMGDTFRMSKGDRAGGEFALAPTKGKFVNSGETDAHGNQIIDVYIGQEPPKAAPIDTTTALPAATEPGGYQISGSVIGKTYENEGITYTVNEDDVRFYLDNIEPMMKNLREAGAAGQGREAFTITGYLPHSDYDPTLLTAEDAMQQGVLWREYTGASTTAEDGTFTTGWLDSDLEARYRTFVNNMLWDSLGEEVTIAKFMEELNADGLDVDVNKVIQLVGGRKRFAEIVSKSDSAKAVAKSLVGDGKLPADTELDEAASKMGATDKVHELYQPVYGSSTGLNQRGNVALMSKSDWMRSLSTGDGSLYDNGGAMIVNGSADAKFMAKRIFEAVENGEKLDTHKMFVEYLTQNHRRTAKGASYIADKWMDKIAQKTSNGGITRRALTAELSRLIYNEGANRVFRFIGRMDTSKLNASNRKALDSLLFRHSMLSKVMNTSGFTAKLNRATNKLISARMKSLFWLNFKNAVLQSSECIRLFTEFKLGDALDTIKRMASDKEFMKEVDEWVDMLVPERYIKGDSSAAIDAAATIAGKSSYANGELTVEKLSRGEISGISKKFDEFASSPVEMGESLKNRVLMAGILQEAHNKGLSGNELFSYVNERFQRIGLAANEMGRLNASDSPLFRLGANLKTFQIRQLSMFLNNINDMNGPKEAVTYILKNLGWKAGLVVILSKLGYSAAATLGIDPFDLMDDDYTGVDEENYTGLDYLVLSPAGKLFLSGGFTGYINDLYWASRKAYEDSAEITEETENRLDKGFWPGMALPGTSFDDVLNSFTGFIPGYTAGKRVVQMNELLDTGWATSATGNKMYTAPDNIFDIAGGYAFGRSNTPNARAYYQTPDYLQGFIDNGFEGVGQQIGREWGAYRQFDPIDSYGYSDWFNGSAADEQQWNSGYYYFLNKVRDMNREYSNSLSEYTTDEQKQSLRDSYNKRLAEVEEQISRFTRAYESKHPEGIDARKMKNLVNVLNIYQPVVSDTPEEAKQRSLDAYSDALYRYTQAGLPAVTSYKRNDEGEIEEVYSPQVRSAIQGQFGLPEEAAAQIKQLYKDKWKELNQKYRNRLFSTSGSKAKKAIQNEYINIVRQDLDPIVRLYGNNIWSNEEVENIIDDVFNSMIPKYGQTPKSYLKNLYKNYSGSIRYNESGNTTLSQINNLLDQGKTAQAKALARTLLQRVQENRAYLNRSEMERLQAILND